MKFQMNEREKLFYKDVDLSEEKYNLVTWLYLIRKQNGRKYGLLQPDFICIIFGPLMPSKATRSNSDIQEAVNAWCSDSTAAEVKYGHISQWDTSRVTTMKELFQDQHEFNDDISKWNVSNVVDMSSMFFKASKFNRDISNWDVRKVRDMDFMFHYTSETAFQDVSTKWDVASIKGWCFSQDGASGSCDEEFKCKECFTVQGLNNCELCDDENICEECYGVGGDYGSHEIWVCNECLPMCLKCEATLYCRDQRCCGKGRSDDSEGEYDDESNDESDEDSA
jgi:surface protein